MLCTLHLTLYTLCSTPCTIRLTVHCMLCTLYCTLCTIHYTAHRPLYTVYHILYTWYYTLCALHPILHSPIQYTHPVSSLQEPGSLLLPKHVLARLSLLSPITVLTLTFASTTESSGLQLPFYAAGLLKTDLVFIMTLAFTFNFDIFFHLSCPSFMKLASSVPSCQSFHAGMWY